ncbi:UDP-glucose/GDP-mannose dehydrogenase family protein [Methanohalobium sp.]|uniref:UDP-glucose dehydrogenase family protein n=1 Tax=Methanohalobium sp. TaxID=2837493 RepID=UPI0025FBEB11|nr:UDP-glucose/GDP-mannose dehydrogenase family protein [Methanohalobium sp.]
MKVSVVGSGYVGTVTAACLAELGHQVICIDIDEERVNKINSGVSPIWEQDLDELIQNHAGGNLKATSDYESAVMDSDISFICVGTPSDDYGNIDLSIVKSASESLGYAIGNKGGYHVVVVKSTVVPETTEKVVTPILEQASGKQAGKDFGVSMNPEFLREGKAVYDFMNPDRIVIGALDKHSGDVVSHLYDKVECQNELIKTNPRTAEMIKYANNSFLATKISFSNEIGNICKKLGIDTYEVMKVVGMDFRISPYFLNSGAGFGGSCFPKDVRALTGKSKEIGYEPILLDSVIRVNENQPHRMIDLLEEKIGYLENKTITVLGLAFKNGTDDIRESRSVPVIADLLYNGAEIKAYDPQANGNMKKVFSSVTYCDSAEEALYNSEACLVMTDWNEFKNLDSEFGLMKNKVVVDGRRIIPFQKLEQEIDYVGICW